MRRNTTSGQALLLSIVLLAVVFGLTGAFVSYVRTVQVTTNLFSAKASARTAAQAGLDKAIWCLNQHSGTNCGGTYNLGYAGETNVAVGSSGYFTTSLISTSSFSKTITSTGYWPNATKPRATVTLKLDASITTETASFYYAIQSGQGGMKFDNQSSIIGNVYANGNIVGGAGAYATGDVWVAGGTSLTADQSSSSTAGTRSDYIFGKTSPAIDIAQSFQISTSAVINKVSFFIKKTSTPSDVTVYILADNNGVPSKTVIGSTTLSAAAVTTTYGWVDASFASPPGLVDNTTYWLAIDAGTSSTKYWTIASQTSGGYANGTGMSSADWSGTPVWTDAGRDFDFKIWTGGVTTKIDTFHAQGDAHANTITNSTVDKNAYYQTLTSSTVSGTKFPGSADPGPTDFPLSDGQIDDLKAEATAGGVINGNVTYDGTVNTLGPKKIVGNMTIQNGATLTLTGTLYVTGTLTINNLATVNLSSNYGASAGGFIVDGNIVISNNDTFSGSGSAGSYVVLVTLSPSLDSLNPAMQLANNSANSIFYAPNGDIEVSNNATIKEVTGFKLHLNNGASVTYETGLANVNFSSGPGASWVSGSGTVRQTQ